MMMRATTWRWVFPTQGVFLGAVVGLTSSAGAIVVNLKADLRSEVQTFVSGAADSSDETMRTFELDVGPDLPIAATAQLNTIDGGATVARGVVVTDFDDPTRVTSGRNPEELALEANCFSGDGVTGHELSGSVVETRTISFSAAELGNPTDNTRQVQSAFFPSGAMLMWSFDGQRDLTGLSATLSFTVRRFKLDGGQEQGSEVLVEQSVSLTGGPSGSIADGRTSDVSALFGDLSILPPIVGLPLGDVSRLEANRLVIIPENQRLNYEYTGTVDEEFVLEATVTVEVSNLPDGTGVAAVFGRPFDEAANVLSLALAEDTAKAIQARLNLAIEEFETPQNVGGRAFGPCGMFGAEMIPMMLLMAGIFAVGRRSSSE